MPYFCYFGCKEKYRFASELEDHLIERHSEDDLRQWGISAKHLLKKQKRKPGRLRKCVDDPLRSDSKNESVEQLA
jgi:hypothetical protein